jgi:hypothetical protein
VLESTVMAPRMPRHSIVEGRPSLNPGPVGTGVPAYGGGGPLIGPELPGQGAPSLARLKPSVGQ